MKLLCLVGNRIIGYSESYTVKQDSNIDKCIGFSSVASNHYIINQCLVSYCGYFVLQNTLCNQTKPNKGLKDKNQKLYIVLCYKS